MASKKTLGLILSGVLALTGIGYSEGISESKIEQQIETIADFTGDGIKDYLVNTK